MSLVPRAINVTTKWDLTAQARKEDRKQTCDPVSPDHKQICDGWRRFVSSESCGDTRYYEMRQKSGRVWHLCRAHSQIEGPQCSVCGGAPPLGSSQCSVCDGAPLLGTPLCRVPSIIPCPAHLHSHFKEGRLCGLRQCPLPGSWEMAEPSLNPTLSTLEAWAPTQSHTSGVCFPERTVDAPSPCASGRDHREVTNCSQVDEDTTGIQSCSFRESLSGLHDPHIPIFVPLRKKW